MLQVCYVATVCINCNLEIHNNDLVVCDLEYNPQQLIM